MDSSRLTQPWYRHASLYSTPRSFLLKLGLGETPESIPAHADVRCGARRPAARIDGGRLDQVLLHYSGAIRVTRLFSAAARVQSLGQRHQGYSDMEQVFGLARTLRVEVAPDCNIGYLLNAIRNYSVVETAGPVYLTTLPFDETVAVRTLDDETTWAARDLIHASEASAYQPADAAVTCAVVDTGVAATHPEFSTGLHQGYDSVNLGLEDIPPGIRLTGDSTEPDRDPADAVGHGTACLSIIGGCGAEIPPGLAFGASLLPGRALGAALFPGRKDPVGIGSCADIDCAMKMAVDLGAKVINCSFGSPVEGVDPADLVPHRDVVLYALSRGCIVVAASGNSSREQTFSPAAIEGVIAVGAVDASGVPARFSTSGSHVALCAPGDRVLSAALVGYSLVTGTSFAAPFVAASCVLLASRALARSYPLDSPAARQILMESATPFPSAVEGKHGAGILNPLAALRLLDQRIDASQGQEPAAPEPYQVH